MRGFATGSRVADALRIATERLPGVEARREAEILLEAVLQRGRAWLFAYSDAVLTDADLARFDALVQRRADGQPVAYLLGQREFFGLTLRVSPATLIPRADTETLVEQALQLLGARQGVRVLDLGTGSGAMALALARHLPRSEVWATDRSDAALQIAQSNSQQLGIGNVRFFAGDWWRALPPDVGAFDLIVSNPPYIDADDPHLQEGDLRFEPRSALVADEHGLADLRWIIDGAPAHLSPGGWLLLEHGWQQGEAVRDLLCQAGAQEVATVTDLGGQPRVSLGRW